VQVKEDVMAERDWDRERGWERGRRYRGEGYYGGYYDAPERGRDWGRPEERGFWDRFGDEVRSWFGDEQAQRRRMRDEREPGGSWRGAHSPRQEHREESRWGGDESVDRDWARQWGYAESRRPEAPGWTMDSAYGGYGTGRGYAGRPWDWSPRDYELGPFESTSRRHRGTPSWFPGQGAAYRGPRHESYYSERYGAGWRSGVPSEGYAGRGPRGYQRSDERIREDVCDQMCDNPELDASEIEVRVSQGEVTLLGSVADRSDKRLAEDLVEEVSGVREVHNQLRVSQGPSRQEPGREGEQPPQRYRAA
jgi:osmotically-inducible protein OsmY